MSKKTKISVVLAAVLVLLIAAGGFLWLKNRPETVDGAKSITFTVVYKDSTQDVFEINTDEEYLANALVNEEIITYDASGLYTTINGVTANYNIDGGWWNIKSGGETASVGMNELPITDGGEYEAVYTTEFIF